MALQPGGCCLEVAGSIPAGVTAKLTVHSQCVVLRGRVMVIDRETGRADTFSCTLLVLSDEKEGCVVVGVKGVGLCVGLVSFSRPPLGDCTGI